MGENRRRHLNEQTEQMTDEKTGLDLALAALSSPTRRRLISTLMEREPVPITAVASDGGVPSDVTAESDVALSLRHVHLPKLESAGYVSWEPETGTVSRGPSFNSVGDVLQALPDGEGAAGGS
jgi:hypothetical protein